MTGQEGLFDKDFSDKDLLGKDLMERGFQLAYFILPDRLTAVRIVAGAMNKLKAQSGRESRRTYWRDKHLKRGITRITRNEQDALQWLIFYEADRYEEEQEKSGGATLRDLVVRYIKNLVRMTTAMSSFHVNVGLQRLLHNYSTAETQRVYETVTERYLGADEYRRAKSVLMNKLEKRFGGLLRTIRAGHGELRFEVEQDQSLWAALVETCLKIFTPWSTHHACPVPSDYNASPEKLPQRLSGKGPDQVDPNDVEINRCHAFIDPICYGRLMRALTFDAPGQRLALPRFFMDINSNDSTGRPTQPPTLAPDERKQIMDELSAQDKRRKNASVQSVSLVVDGMERARLDLHNPDLHNQSGATFTAIEIEEGAELIELRAQQESGDLLLAVQPVLYEQGHGIAPLRIILFRQGWRKFALEIVPGPQTAEGPRHAAVKLSYTANPLAEFLHAGLLHAGLLDSDGDRQAWSSGTRFSRTRYAAGALALVTVGWGLGIATHMRMQKPQTVAALPLLTPATQMKPTEPVVALENRKNIPQVSAALSFVLVPDEDVVRTVGSAGYPSVSLPSQPVVVNLELPIDSAHVKKSFRASLKEFQSHREILSESHLKAKKTAKRSSVLFALPSVMLENRQDYAVDLSATSPEGASEDVGSYTFRAVRILDNKR